jgi:hypothetical protein
MNIFLLLSYVLLFVGMIPSYMSEKMRLMSYRKRRSYYLLAILANLLGITFLTIELIF